MHLFGIPSFQLKKKNIYEFQMNIYQLYNYPQSLPCNKYCEL